MYVDHGTSKYVLGLNVHYFLSSVVFSNSSKLSHCSKTLFLYFWGVTTGSKEDRVGKCTRH